MTLDDTGPAAEFPARLQDSVEAHLMADVPLGLFFSGGVDSSAILAALADLRARDGHAEPILSYTVRFDTEADDETALAAALAAGEGAEFIDVPYGRDDFLADAGLAALACDDPVADYAILPTSHLARRAARDVKVVLSARAAMNSSPDMAATAPGCALLARAFRHGPAPPCGPGCSPAPWNATLPDITAGRPPPCRDLPAVCSTAPARWRRCSATISRTGSRTIC